MTYQFTDEQRELLKSLNNRVLNQLPRLREFSSCIITGPAVSELAMGHTLIRDKTFVILAPDKETLEGIKDLMWELYTLRPSSTNDGMKFLVTGKYIKWFSMEYIDLIAEDVYVFRGVFPQLINMILAVGPERSEYAGRFKYHPIHCHSGKTYVNVYRLREPEKYVRSDDEL